MRRGLRWTALRTDPSARVESVLWAEYKCGADQVGDTRVMSPILYDFSINDNSLEMVD